MLGFGKTKTRKLQYEVLCRRAGRWQVSAIYDDEKQAVREAETLLGGDKIEAVKVISQRDGLNGGIVEAEIMVKEAAAREKPLQVVADNTPVEACASLKDFYALDSRLAIGRLLRPFLDKMQITPAELLHSYRMIARLDNTGNLTVAAINRVGTLQAQALKTQARHRIAEVERLVTQVRDLARTYEAERTKLPPLESKDLGAQRRRLRMLLGDELRGDHALMSHLAQHLSAAPSLLAKVDSILELAGAEPDADAFDLLEGVLADILAHPEALRDLFGAQPTLAKHVAMLAACVGGQPLDQAWKDGSPLARLSGMIAAGLAPQCRRVLIARIQTVIASPAPLDANQPEQENVLLLDLQQRLDDGASGLIGGEATAKAIAQRRQRQQTALRRSLGLD